MEYENIFNDPKGYKRWYEEHNKIYDNERNVVRSFNLKDCLDIGSGPGIFHEVIHGYKVSVDISLLMLMESKSDDSVLSDALYLPFRNKSFDCTFTSVTICFIDSLEKFISEIERVTKKRAVICFIPRDSPWGKYYDELGKKGHKYYSRAIFRTKEEIYKTINKYMKIITVRSTLSSEPSNEKSWEDNDIYYDDDRGSFICVEAITR
ncbi:methyltransferase [Sulfolobus sp. A20]|uniref:class I SAM-dependent methyltransferase n=1 Tax=Saccharolobus sp. A20 TaxID=1891280 RepID=UPI00084600DD|nr:class I SAM-dependent methyltransferase [Sulfolobus sp. A20]TRM77017.1 class I SAM-dependent methyltransferase [Sulfolobus sp. B5]TRM77490.1 class I SAM-dependent methyltransferase [Sulfolobus sp. A20-N-F8]TRM83444.1 class I SAM-dependent methyltransferase [Sulfolobus sp. A20-N-F6]TRM86517.1 class I SAM-dependent methyltransferase [Sulfolobus sp. C3]TRM93464.1 class I SAM-dependent methyltransferase [Sulfolobus sp. A20-N-G8]TRM97304.1 class I SAM-dependent methyltransferase [Sulfolobus sp.